MFYNGKMNGQSTTRSERWGLLLKHLRAGLRRTAPFAAGIFAALIAIYLYGVIFPGPHQLTTGDVSNIVGQAMASATPPPAFSATAFQAIAPSVVVVQSYPPSQTNKLQEDALGSGVVVDDKGDIMTSLHIVAGAGDIEVTFADGTHSKAQVTAQQPENDIAVLQAIQLPARISPAVLGNPGSMNVGDEAYVVGNPFGLNGSMSAGVISGFNRVYQLPGSDQQLKGLIQLDTAVNPGSSGAPLVNRYGEVIGIVEGNVNPTGQNVFIGISFAVPITTAGGVLGSPPD